MLHHCTLLSNFSIPSETTGWVRNLEDKRLLHVQIVHESSAGHSSCPDTLLRWSQGVHPHPRVAKSTGTPHAMIDFWDIRKHILAPQVLNKKGMHK